MGYDGIHVTIYSTMDPSWDIKQNYLEHLLNIQPLEVQFRSPNPLLGSMKDAECLVAGGCAILSLTNGICCGLSPNYERIVGKTPVLTILYYTISFYVVNSMHLKSHPFLLINSLGPIKLPTCQWNFPSCVLCFLYSGFEMEYITWLQSPTETAVWPSLANEIPIT